MSRITLAKIILKIVLSVLISNLVAFQVMAEPFRFAFGSCSDRFDEEVWSSISDSQPDFVLLLGDNIYADPQLVADFAAYENKYVSMYRNKFMQSFINHIPVYAVWDDNETGIKDADSTNPYLSKLRKFHFSFWQFPKGAEVFPDSVAISFEHKGVLFLATDNRSFRLNYNSSDTPQMFGDKQLSWIESKIENSSASTVVLASGNQILTNDVRYEALRQYPKEFKRVLRLLIKSKKRVIVISGDRHFAEILRLKTPEKEVFEFTSSPLTAGVAPDSIMQGDQLRLRVSNSGNNFGLIEVNSKGKVLGQIIDSQGKLLIEHKVNF